MVLPTAAREQVAELGIDDFAFRRGRKFGTILVDLQSHNVIDLLPDRKAETAKAWMKAHPEIKLVSRDRGGDYASAAASGAPQAIQCADRFHVLVRRIGACLDSFQRKEGLRAKTPKTVAYLAGKPKEDSSMRQRQTCPKAFTARSACLARHGEATLPNLAYQRR
jgi:transposase